MGPSVSPSSDHVKDAVREYWNNKPCGSEFVEPQPGTRAYYEALEFVRYDLEPHILEVVPFAECRDLSVLEIGCGSGIDALQFVRHGARYTGIDLTPAAVDLTSRALDVFGFSGESHVADAEALPFEDASFDLVYSHGVLHHTPDTQRAVDEVRRVLRPGGRAIVMLYHRRSYNYYVNIMFFRRIGVRLLGPRWAPAVLARLTGYELATLQEHRSKQLCGLAASRADFLSANTDGPGNPLSKAYTASQARRLFRSFERVVVRQRYLNKRHVPIVGRYLPRHLDAALGRIMGWHLYITATK